MTLDQLPVPKAFNPRAPLAADDRAEAQAAFIAEVARKVEGQGFAIGERRIFSFVGYDPKGGPEWVILHAEVGNALLDNFSGKEFYDHIDAKGPYHLSMWRLPGGQVIAVSQSFELTDGSALVGYFVLQKR